MVTHLQGRFDAIQQLHSLLVNYPPGSTEYEVADHAIDLALSEGREFTSYFCRDLLGDSRRILSRQRSQRPTLSLTPNFCLESSSLNEDEDGMLEVTPALLTDPCTPEKILGANEFAAEVIQAVGGNTTIVQKVFGGMLYGENLEETAQKAKVSNDYVNKIRGRIRRAASTVPRQGRLQ